MTTDTRMSKFVRSLIRLLARTFALLMTRTTVTGTENIPTAGPMLVAANHASTYDPVVYISYLPSNTFVVGPGDFKLLWPANLVFTSGQVIPTNRGALDRKSIKAMADVLKAEKILALFPEGGTWEKQISDVKPGAAYLSYLAKSPILPVSISGTYQVWHDIFRFKRPKIQVHFHPPVDPVIISDRKKQQEELHTASLDLMHVIYSELSTEEQQRYDLAARQQFSATVALQPPQADVAAFETQLRVIAELISKPNLFSPLHRNAKLPLDPFVEAGTFFPAHDVQIAVHALKHAFEGDFQNYLVYRLGDEKAQAIFAELDELQKVVDDALNADLFIKIEPMITD